MWFLKYFQKSLSCTGLKRTPVLEKGQQLVEGNIWVDKYTGEIKFDPKKNRDDHRHMPLTP